MKKNSICIIFLFLFLFQQLTCMYEAIVEQFQKDIEGVRPKVKIDQLSPRLLDVYGQISQKAHSRIGEMVAIRIAKTLSALPTEKIFLLPDDNGLHRLGLCPLFSQAYKPSYTYYNQDSVRLSGWRGLSGTPAFEAKEINGNTPCSVVVRDNTQLIQLKTVDQGEVAELTHIEYALCGGYSLHNGMVVRDYALSGKQDKLKQLINPQSAASFLQKVGATEWATIQEVKEFITQAGRIGYNASHISAVSTALLFGTEPLSWFDMDEYDYAQGVKLEIHDGLQQNYYVHVLIIGNEEAVEQQLGHYFAFVIIKVGNVIQYVVIDTSSSIYHLQKNSHERKRLKFIIAAVEGSDRLPELHDLKTARIVSEQDLSDSIQKKIIEENTTAYTKLNKDVPEAIIDLIGELLANLDALQGKADTVFENYKKIIKKLRDKVNNQKLYAVLFKLIEEEQKKAGIERERKAKFLPKELTDEEKTRLRKEIIRSTDFSQALQASEAWENDWIDMDAAEAIRKSLHDLNVKLIIPLCDSTLQLSNLTNKELDMYKDMMMRIKDASPEFNEFLPKKDEKYSLLLTLIKNEISRRSKLRK